MVLEKTLESPLDCKKIQPVHPKGDQSWVFIGRTDVEAETPIFWPPDMKSNSFEKSGQSAYHAKKRLEGTRKTVYKLMGCGDSGRQQLL